MGRKIYDRLVLVQTGFKVSILRLRCFIESSNIVRCNKCIKWSEPQIITFSSLVYISMQRYHGNQ